MPDQADFVADPHHTGQGERFEAEIRTLIWPAEWTHAHAGKVLNSGTKYIITGWMHFPG